jgi:four helix bundle protein
MPVTRSYRDLDVWQRAMDLLVESYRIAHTFPPLERHGLASQLRRAAVSIPANIAEGNGRRHRGEYVHHVSIARGSLTELETHLEAARRLGYSTEVDLRHAVTLAARVGRMLTRLGDGLVLKVPSPQSRVPNPDAF